MSVTKVYIQNIYARAEEAEKTCRQFFPERMKKALRFRRREDSLRSFAAALLLKEVLGLEEADLTVGEYGKPVSSACPEQFSLSHSGSWTVLAVSSVPVGVDIETVNPSHLDLASHVFTREEISWFETGSAETGSEGEAEEKHGSIQTETGAAACSRCEAEVRSGRETETEAAAGSRNQYESGAQRFFALWTLKESLSKALGKGLSLSFQSVNVLPMLSGSTVAVEKQSFSGSVRSYQDCMLAVCMEIPACGGLRCDSAYCGDPTGENASCESPKCEASACEVLYYTL